MNIDFFSHWRRAFVLPALLPLCLLSALQANANPTGGTVTQGSATFSGSGSTFNINQTSANAFINWNTFNIGAGETVNFNQPSATSVTWNYVNGPGASGINGDINANGLVVLQNPNGFTVGGSAAITTHGLVMTTASTPEFDLSSGGPWTFNTPPPTAKIVNYGRINVTSGGSAFLIANDIENNGAISAPGGKIGLYAGQTVLLSTAPDGRGLSAQVTIPQGMVDNNGNLVADAGSVALQAQTVNQNGLIQANSIQNVNGTIELVASDSVNLGANSTISAQGDSQGVSSGGSVTIQGGNTFSDQAGSTINVAGGAQGGNGGSVSICAPEVDSLNTSINGQAVNGYVDGVLSLDPQNIQLVSSGGTGTTTQYSTGTVNSSDPPNPGTLVLDVNDFSSSLSTINLQAINNIEVSTLWTLSPSTSSGAQLTLTAGNSIIIDNAAGISAGNNWTVNLTAGTAYSGTTAPASGSDGIYLNGSAYLQAANGNLNLWAANEVIVNSGAIRTIGGGNIGVTAEYGNVNSGNNANGFLFGQKNAPYYTVSTSLGGIGTVAGGNVTITAGGNVISFLPTQNNYKTDSGTAAHDAGIGAFGPEAGNVTITAGGNVSGNYVLANGIGTVTAGGTIGAPTSDSNLADDFALSLISGGWSVFAPHGNIYIQDVINPNGVFGEATGKTVNNYPGYHYFNYSPTASLLLDAGGSVEFTGNNAPDSPPGAGGLATIPMLLPPSLQIIAGGDLTLDTSIVLFPSPDQYLNLSIAGDFITTQSSNPINLEMSDSSATQWLNSTTTFGTSDNASTPPELNNPYLNPVEITVGGNIEYANIYADEKADITVGGNMENSSFTGQNLHPGDVTTINVTGAIENSPLYSFEPLTAFIAGANPQQPGVWDSVFDLALNPILVSELTSLDVNDPHVIGPNGLAYFLNENGYLLFPTGSQNTQYGQNPGFVYDPSSLQIGFKGNLSAQLSATQIAALEGGTFTVLVADSSGNPVIVNGHLETMTYTFSAASAISGLAVESQNNVLATTGVPNSGINIEGPGQLNINAGSMDLGDSSGISSDGFQNNPSLEGVSGALASGGAGINLQVAGNINMITSAIDSIDGGNVTVNAGGTITASQGSFNFETPACYGIYTTGHSDVSVTANGDIDIGSGCIGAFNGGNAFVESYDGNVNAGSGLNKALDVNIAYIDSGIPTIGEYGSLAEAITLLTDPAPYGSGILAEYPTAEFQTPGGNGAPGNITVLAPHGNIIASEGGISQFALDQSTAGGPTVTLAAGTAGIAATPDQGNIILGTGGVIGGTINVNAQGTVQGLIISRQDANINAVQSFSGTVLSGGSANFSGGGSISGTIVGIGGISTGGGDVAGATLLSQNISGGNGASYSSLATSASTSASSQSAAQQASQNATQVANNDDNSDDQKKKKKKAAVLHVGHVTVILPKGSS